MKRLLNTLFSFQGLHEKNHGERGCDLAGVVDVGATRVKFGSRCRGYDEPQVHEPISTGDFVEGWLTSSEDNDEYTLGDAILSNFLSASHVSCNRITKFSVCVSGSVDARDDRSDISPLGALGSIPEEKRLNVQLKSQLTSALKLCGRENSQVIVQNDAACLGVGIVREVLYGNVWANASMTKLQMPILGLTLGTSVGTVVVLEDDEKSGVFLPESWAAELVEENRSAIWKLLGNDSRNSESSKFESDFEKCLMKLGNLFQSQFGSWPKSIVVAGGSSQRLQALHSTTVQGSTVWVLSPDSEQMRIQMKGGLSFDVHPLKYEVHCSPNWVCPPHLSNWSTSDFHFDTYARSGLNVLKDGREIKDLLKQGKIDDASSVIYRAFERSKKGDSASDIFQPENSETVLRWLISDDQSRHEELVSIGTYLRNRLMFHPQPSHQNDTHKASGTRRSEIVPYLMDHSLREHATTSEFGQTTEIKLLTLQLLRAVGFQEFAISALYYGDLYSVEDQILELMMERKESFSGCFVMCGVSSRTRAIKAIRRFRVPNLFFDVQLLPNTRFKNQPIKNVTDAILSALQDADRVLPQRTDRGPSLRSYPAHGEVYVNFVDLMEFLDLEPNGRVNHERNMTLATLFATLSANPSFKARVSGILFEESKGKASHTDYGLLARYLRAFFPNLKLLTHAHGGGGLEQAASLEAFDQGADGIWAGFISAGAQGGHNSLFGFIFNLLKEGNPHVLHQYNLSRATEIAKTIHRLNFNSVSIPRNCPIYGDDWTRLTHTDFDFTSEWRRYAQNDFNRLHQDEHEEIEQRLKKIETRSKFGTDLPSRKQTAYRIAPLVSDPGTIGARLLQDGSVFFWDHGRCKRSDVEWTLGTKVQKVMLDALNANLRVNFDSPQRLREALEIGTRTHKRESLERCAFFDGDRVVFSEGSLRTKKRGTVSISNGSKCKPKEVPVMVASEPGETSQKSQCKPLDKLRKPEQHDEL